MVKVLRRDLSEIGGYAAAVAEPARTTTRKKYMLKAKSKKKISITWDDASGMVNMQNKIMEEA